MHTSMIRLVCVLFLGGVPVGSPTSTGDFVCSVTKKESYRVEYSILQTSTEARMAPLVEYKQLSMCTLSVQNCSAWPLPIIFY